MSFFSNYILKTFSKIFGNRDQNFSIISENCQQKFFFLEKNIKKFILPNFLSHTRTHSLKSFNTNILECYIKRDDELGLIGSKKRKFSSLIPYLLNEKYEEVVLIGGVNSNHVLGLVQILVEYKLQPRLFLYENRQAIDKGNALLLKLLITDPQIHWVSRKEAEERAFDYASQNSKKTCVIPEGGCMPEALPGALTLALDILENENKLGFSFDHLFVDSGTGLMAIALILGTAFQDHPAHIHVVLIAGNEEEFLNKLKVFYQAFIAMGFKTPFPTRFSLSRPKEAKSFGSVTANTLDFVQKIARQEGVLCDPIYNAKLLLEAKRKIFDEALEGRALIIQSGGTPSLLGFLTR